MLNVMVVLEVVGICMIFAAMLLLLSGENAREQKLMVYFLCGSLIQNGGYFLEILAPTMEAAVVAVKIQYFGSIFVPLCYCRFMFSYCRRKSPNWIIGILGAIDFALLAVIFSSDQHKWYYQNIQWLATDGGHHYLSIDYGPLYVVFMVCGCILPYVLSFYALSRVVFGKTSHSDEKKYKLIMFLSVLPVLALVSYAAKLTYVFDFTPVVLGLALSSVVILVWSRRNYDFRQLASGVVLESMADGVIALDEEKRIISCNKAAAEIFAGYVALKPGELVTEIAGFRDNMLEEGVRAEFNLNGRNYESHSKKIIDDYGNDQGYVVLILDMTDTKNYIEEIKSVREQAERANMAKSEFLANMSHEIRTPMNAIMGLSDIIMEENRGLKEFSYACDIKSAAQNLLTIINDILDLSKVEAGKMELVKIDYYIKGLLKEVVTMMDIAASQRGLTLKYEIDNSIPCRYHGDEGRIKQILINLINNAIKFTKEGYVSVTLGESPVIPRMRSFSPSAWRTPAAVSARRIRRKYSRISSRLIPRKTGRWKVRGSVFRSPSIWSS